MDLGFSVWGFWVQVLVLGCGVQGAGFGGLGF